ncbi:ABC transporter substrate-binding protein [Paenibacillus sp. IB182496]|uniref:ABC transporter substrate-binding protein n=1 Tax=Paenibacillus sabuli TaxID=2772509 RepID=A0A927GTC4_9BACL|nr:ABC transporter substrate-binding protein [Paenibacillus sabuli]MBD2847679.1 ABC transporter substrate-binding protein [Paenibacillus sabuli]
MLLLLVVIFTLSACASSDNEPNGNAGNAQYSAGSDNQEAEADAGAANDAEAQGEDAASGGGELIVVDQNIAASLDPVQPLTSSYLRKIGAAEALFKVNAAGETVPELAEEATQVDPTTWEIRLRPGATFWSGAAVDADAVIASLERSRANDAQAQPFLAELTLEKVDAATLRVTTSRAQLPVPLNLSYYQTVIHNAGQAHDSVETMDLTGMYRVTAFTPKQSMELARNEHYWGAAPAIERIVYEEVADEQTRVLSALSGRSHVVYQIPVTSMPQFESREDVEISAEPAANTQTVYLNLSRPQLADVQVRQALAWGVDREELVIAAAEGQSTPVTTWLGSNPAFAEAKNAVYSAYDPDQAGALLDDAGWMLGEDGIRYKDGEPLQLRLMTWGQDQALGEALQSQWGRIGVQVEVQHGDYSLIQTARESGDWDASIEAWSTFGEELTLLQGQYAPEGSGNYGGYNDEETNALLAQLAEAADQQSRRELTLQINTRVAEQAPVISLYPRPQLTAVSTALQGFEPHFRQFEHIVHAGLTLAAR